MIPIVVFSNELEENTSSHKHVVDDRHSNSQGFCTQFLVPLLG